MINLKFKVTETKVILLEQSENITRGNINQIDCEFELDSVFEDLIVRAVFNNEARRVINNKCTAPEFKDYKVIVGVYGYRSNGDSMEKVVSPEPCAILTKSGSYNHCVIESVEPAPTELEKYYELTNAELENKQDKINVDFKSNGEGKRFLSDDGKYKEIALTVDSSLSETSANAVENKVVTQALAGKQDKILTEIEIAAGTQLMDIPVGRWIVKSDTTISDLDGGELSLYKGDIIKAVSESNGSDADNIMIVTDDRILVGEWADNLNDMRLLSAGDIASVTDSEFNKDSNRPIRNSVVAAAIDELKPKIEYPDSYFFMAKKNTEYRYLYPGADKIQVAVPTLSASTKKDYISSLVFRSPETATEFTYQKDMIFTGDDCEDGVFIPQPKTVYNIVFWYDGYSYNAVARGVAR